MKKCCTCKENKHFSDFTKNKFTVDGFEKICKSCKHEYYLKNRERIIKNNRNNRLRNPDAKKNYDLMESFEITLGEYNQKLKEQNNVCYICGGVDKKKKLAVDHNHITGQVRSLLCSKCNLILGQVKEDINLLKSIISYIKKWS